MKLKTTLVILIVVAFLSAGTIRPRPAQASTSDIILYAAIGLGVYITVVVIAAIIVYGETDTSVVIAQRGLPQLPEREPATVRAGRHCPQHGERVTLLCW